MAFWESVGPLALGTGRARPSVGAREEIKSGGSNNVNNNSSDGGSGANKDDSKRRATATTTAAAVRTAAGASVRAAVEGEKWHEIDSRVLKAVESNSMSSAANSGARGGR